MQGNSVLRNFDVKPANEMFSKNIYKIQFFQKNVFLEGMTSKIEFEQNWRYGYVLTVILWIRVLIGYTQLSLIFFHYYRPIQPIKKNHFSKKIHDFLIENLL